MIVATYSGLPTRDNFTNKGFLSHWIQLFWSSQSSHSAESCMSKLHSIRARIRRISRYARLFFSSLVFSVWGEGERGAKHLLSANATTWTNREGLRYFTNVSRKVLVTKPAFRSENIWICKIGAIAMSCVAAELHISLHWKVSQP